MKTFKNLFFLAFLALVATVFTSNVAQAQTGANDRPALEFNTDDIEDYKLAKLPGRLPDGRTVIATHKKTGTQIAVLVRGGKLVQLGTVVKGRFTSVSPTSGPCNNVICTTFQIKKCFIMPWGGCICICGSWITAG
jgi:hypothetical protein